MKQESSNENRQRQPHRRLYAGVPSRNTPDKGKLLLQSATVTRITFSATLSAYREALRVVANYASLVRLGDIRKDNIDARKKHTVSIWKTGVFNDG